MAYTRKFTKVVSDEFILTLAIIAAAVLGILFLSQFCDCGLKAVTPGL